jgi:hypothetical protein
MKIFASVSPEHFEGTVEYDCGFHGPDCYGCVFIIEREVPFVPSNPLNPILALFRDADDSDRRDLAARWVDDIAEWHQAGEMGIDTTPDQVEHARRVLTRFAEFNPEPYADLCAECAPDGIGRSVNVTHCESCGQPISGPGSTIGARRDNR